MTNMSDAVPAEQADRENRSVNDFDTPEELRLALTNMDIKRSGRNGGPYVSFGQPTISEQPLREKQASGVKDKNGTDDSEPAELDPKLDWVLENYDKNTTEAQSIDDELQRLLVLKSYLMLDSEKKESFERITGLASRIFQCPMALISLVDIGRQWFMSNRGLGDARETSRKSAFCAHAIMSNEDFLIVPDATKDFRFKDNPLVLGPPHIRFYAGAPLVSPEGYKLGTLCVLDRSPRPDGLSMEDKQNLMELAALAVQSAVQHKNNKTKEISNPAQMIAYTAHDLLTPLTGVQLSLSLLAEDENFTAGLTPQQKEMVVTASKCSDMMGRICQTAIRSFQTKKDNDNNSSVKRPSGGKSSVAPLSISKLVKSLYLVMNPLPKKVPLAITVDPQTPDVIFTDELKVFRSAVNFLTNACSETEHGCVRMTISPVTEDGDEKLLFECIDTGPGVPVELYPKLFKPIEEPESQQEGVCMKPRADGSVEALSKIDVVESGLGLYSVAVHISSLGGEYGFRPRPLEGENPQNGKQTSGSVFWFKIPAIVPDSDGMPFRRSSSGRLFDESGRSDGGFRTSIVKVLSTPTISSSVATQVYDTFTKVLEADIQNPNGNFVCGNDQPEVPPAPVEDTPMSSRTKDAIEVEAGSTRTKKALVIEDSMVVRKSLTRVLTKLGFETVQAVDGMEGFRELQNALFDVVFCDFLMPVMDGLDCVQQYREWETNHRPFFHQHIIGISAHAGENDIAKGLEVGMDDFKPKPVTFKQLSELVTSEELQAVGKQLDKFASEGKQMIDIENVLDSGNSPVSTRSSGASSPTDLHEQEMQNHRPSATSVHFCLVAIEAGKAEIGFIENATSQRGWQTAIVHDGEAALRLMKMRNWDLVILDEDLPILHCSQCVARFREWEAKNRVNRQRNVVLLSSTGMDMMIGSESMVQLPFGFDVSLGKPIRPKEFDYLMAQAERSEMDFGVRDFVPR